MAKTSAAMRIGLEISISRKIGDNICGTHRTQQLLFVDLIYQERLEDAKLKRTEYGINVPTPFFNRIWLRGKVLTVGSKPIQNIYSRFSINFFLNLDCKSLKWKKIIDQSLLWEEHFDFDFFCIVREFGNVHRSWSY